MNRRDASLAVLAIAAGVIPVRALAQRATPRRVGYLIATKDSDFPVLHDALRGGLRDLGYVDGQNLEILVRSADGDAARFPVLVAELMRHDVDVYVAANSPAALAAAKGAPAKAVVFAGVGDPVGLGIAQSLARPGGNATGITLLTPELTPKRLSLLKETVPRAARIAVLWNPDVRGHAAELEALETIARSLDARLLRIAVQRSEDLDAAFASMAREQAEALIVLASPLHHRNIQRIAELALERRLPGVCEFSEFAGVGGLMVYGPSWPALYRHAATFVAKILEGAKPADLPIEQPTRIELVVNLSTARKLSIVVPLAVLARVDRTIGS